MPKPYSADLRERVLAACEPGEAGRAAVAQRFNVSGATGYNWLRQAREEGRRAAKPHAGGPAPKVDADGHAVDDPHAGQGGQRRHARRVRRALCRAHGPAGQPGPDVRTPPATRPPA